MQKATRGGVPVLRLVQRALLDSLTLCMCSCHDRDGDTGATIHERLLPRLDFVRYFRTRRGHAVLYVRSMCVPLRAVERAADFYRNTRLFCWRARDECVVAVRA